MISDQAPAIRNRFACPCLKNLTELEEISAVRDSFKVLDIIANQERCWVHGLIHPTSALASNGLIRSGTLLCHSIAEIIWIIYWDLKSRQVTQLFGIDLIIWTPILVTFANLVKLSGMICRVFLSRIQLRKDFCPESMVEVGSRNRQ